MRQCLLSRSVVADDQMERQRNVGIKPADHFAGLGKIVPRYDHQIDRFAAPDPQKVVDQRDSVVVALDHPQRIVDHRVHGHIG